MLGLVDFRICSLRFLSWLANVRRNPFGVDTRFLFDPRVGPLACGPTLGCGRNPFGVWWILSAAR
jgi:hypothetical protein